MSSRRRALLIGSDRYQHLGEGYALEGCRRDVELMRDFLMGRAGYEEPLVLVDEKATREAIQSELQELLTTSGPRDLITFFFSGHGSRRPRQAEGQVFYDEALVPYNSGHRLLHGEASAPNQDISDKEIHAWLSLMSRQVRHVTLILDCCHSGGLMRDPFSARVRQVPEDPRSVRSAPIRWQDPWQGREVRRIGDHTLLAACRSRELAYELPSARHGALTFYLARALEQVPPRVTFDDLLGLLAPRVTARFPGQHPVLYGCRNREPFGTGLNPKPYALPVSLDRNGLFKIRTGSLHLATPGSRYRIFTERESAEPPPFEGLVELVTVRPSTSTARRLEGSELSMFPKSGAQALLEAYAPSHLQTTVGLGEELVEHPFGKLLKRRIEASPQLERDKNGIESPKSEGLLIRRLVPRLGTRGPLPQLGAIGRELLAVVGDDGKLALPVVPMAEEAATLDRLLGNLEQYARYEKLLRLESPSSGDLSGKIDLELWRREGEHRTPIGSGAEADQRCRAGDQMTIRVTNGSQRTVYLYLFDFGLAGRVSLLYPTEEDEVPLSKGAFRELGTDPRGAPIVLSVPPELPFDQILGRPRPAARYRSEHLKLFASTHRIDLRPLRQSGYRQARAPHTAHALNELLQLAWTGGDVYRRVLCRRKGIAEELWTTVQVAFEVEI